MPAYHHKDAHVRQLFQHNLQSLKFAASNEQTAYYDSTHNAYAVEHSLFDTAFLNYTDP